MNLRESRARIWSETPLHTAVGDDDLAALERALAASAAVAHEVRCGRQVATTPVGASDWSSLVRAVTGEQAAIVLALVRSAGLDPAAVAAESDDEAARRAPERGIYPVHLAPLRELLAAPPTSHRAASTRS